MTTLKDSCEATGTHRYMWLSSDHGVQIWVCTQCGEERREYEDSQP